MVQRDYILREIERIGTIMSAIRHKLFGGKENLSLTLEKQVMMNRQTENALDKEERLKSDIMRIITIK